MKHTKMSKLAALSALFCDMEYQLTPDEIEEQRRYMRQIEEVREREKHEIFDVDQFERYSKVEGDTGALGVKVLRDKTGVLHFIYTAIWPFHYPYCVSVLGETRTLQEFNEQMYTGKDRSMPLGIVMAYTAPAKQRYWCLELNPADPMENLDVLNSFFEDVRKGFMTKEEEKPTLYFHPTSAQQIEAIKDKQICLPIITSQTLFGGIKYQMIYPGELHYKTIRVFNQKRYVAEDLNNWLLKRTADDIVVIPSVPNDIPVVGGVICGEIIPPLCHVALLCQNRKTPCCYMEDCIGMISKLADRPVFGVIAKQGLRLDGDDIPPNNMAQRPQKPAPSKVEVQAPNTSVTSLIDIQQDKQHAKDIHIVGAKASQMAVIESIYNQPIFKGTFVIPFHHYDKHVSLSNDVSVALQTRFANMTRRDFNYNEFKQVQEAIKNHPIAHELVLNVIERIKQHKMTSVIFRSSTNAEDLTGFNGAGLYESVPLFGDNVHDPQQVGKAIKRVWASSWSPVAVKERQYYQIAHSSVNVSVLVQPFIDEHTTGVKVHYNGVCITHDVSRHAVKHGFVVNCFAGTKHRATNIYKDQFPEHTTLVLGREENSVDLHVMTLATGHAQSLITQQDAEKMVSVFGSLHTSMLNKPHKLDDTVALDIEFMVVESDKREIVVLQARPYNVNVPTTETNLDADVQSSAYAYSWATDKSRKVWFSSDRHSTFMS